MEDQSCYELGWIQWYRDRQEKRVRGGNRRKSLTQWKSVIMAPRGFHSSLWMVERYTQGRLYMYIELPIWGKVYYMISFIPRSKLTMKEDNVGLLTSVIGHNMLWCGGKNRTEVRLHRRPPTLWPWRAGKDDLDKRTFQQTNKPNSPWPKLHQAPPNPNEVSRKPGKTN